MRESKKGNRNPKFLTTGEANKIIDDLVHPLFKKNKDFIWFDGLLHAMVEQNPPVTIQKFIRYSLPKILGTTNKRASLKKS
jgi:hypothetical protein